MSCVPDIHLEAFFPRETVSPVRLGIASEAGANIVAMVLLIAVARKILHQQRSWTDDGHVALEDVPKFRKFVKGGRAKELAVANEALFVGKWLAFGVRLAGHRAELDEAENLLVFART